MGWRRRFDSRNNHYCYFVEVAASWFSRGGVKASLIGSGGKGSGGRKMRSLSVDGFGHVRANEACCYHWTAVHWFGYVDGDHDRGLAVAVTAHNLRLRNPNPHFFHHHLSY